MSLLFSTGIFLSQIVYHSIQVLLIQLDRNPMCSNLLAQAPRLAIAWNKSFPEYAKSGGYA